jgi:hypothetical protein
MDPDPDPVFFVIDLQDANKKLFSAYYFLKVHLHHFSKVKSHKEVIRQVFLLFLLGNKRIKIRIRIQEAQKDIHMKTYMNIF